MSDLVVARNCCMTRMLPGEAELVSELTGLPGKTKSVKRFERSNGLDTALYKNYLYMECHIWLSYRMDCIHIRWKTLGPTNTVVSIIDCMHSLWTSPLVQLHFGLELSIGTLRRSGSASRSRQLFA